MKTLLTIFASVVLAGPAFTGEAARPNILFILADDMGYSDPGCFGGEIKTPALDRLASSGLVVSRFHNGGMCVVSRLSLMTGRWWPSAQREFGKQRILPEVLREKGYRTALINPHFPALRPVPLALSWASRRKQIPSSKQTPSSAAKIVHSDLVRSRNLLLSSTTMKE